MSDRPLHGDGAGRRRKASVLRDRAQPPAVDTDCAKCGEGFSDTRAMAEVADGVWVHSHDCEGFGLGATVVAPLAFFGALFGLFGGVLLLAALDWLWPAVVGVSCVVCISLAWAEWRGKDG